MFPPFDPPANVEWFRPTTKWFNVPPVAKQTPKRGRDSVDDLTASLKRLRTSESEQDEKEETEEEEKEEKKETEPKLSTSTALVLARPARTQRIDFFNRLSVPDYALSPPLGSFPVVLYKGPPSPTLSPKNSDDPPDIEEYTALSKDNRTLRVSPSFTIELVDDEEEEAPQPQLSPAMNDEIASVQSQLKATTMADDED
jgi:hypothetical protein